MSEETASGGSKLFEKHLQTGLQIIIVAGVVWIFQEVQALTISSATMQAELRVVTSQMRALEEQALRRTEDRYTSRDAARDWSRLDREISGVEARVRALEIEAKENMKERLQNERKEAGSTTR
ncbi:MAG: hypothetical protein AAFR84_00935 [Pseudomonadota bacterium]